MKRQKEVFMECPNCGAVFYPEPLLYVDTGRMILEQVRKCKECGTNTIRRVRK